MGKKLKKPLLYDSEIEKIEKAFFSPTKEKELRKKNKKLINITIFIAIIVTMLGLFLLSLRYRIIVVPRIYKPTRSLLTRKFLASVRMVDKKGKVKFSQGIIYLPLFYQKPQGFILNTKTPLNLATNYLAIHLDLLDKDVNPKNIEVKCIIRDEKYYSNALTPLRLKLPEDIFRKKLILLDFDSIKSLNLNTNRIRQIRLVFLNLRNQPISLLIKDIKLTEKSK